MGKLDGKVALITGAGQGVGQGIAFALAGEGAKIAVTGRTAGKLDDTCAEIEKRGGMAIPIECNVRDTSQIEATISKTVETLGGLDILVNNAQEVPLGSLHDVTDESFEAGWESGPLATFRFMKAAHPHLKASGAGSIINLATSAAMRWDMKGYGPYAAVKEATRSLTRAAANEWAEDSIRANTIAPLAMSPGMEMWIELMPDEANAFIDTVPMKRVGDCEQDIGRVVVFLCSSDAGYLTGATIPLDGGQARFV